MKGGLAAMLVAMKTLGRVRDTLKGKVIFASEVEQGRRKRVLGGSFVGENGNP